MINFISHFQKILKKNGLFSQNIITFVMCLLTIKTKEYMKKIKWMYVLLATFLLTSCGTLMQPYQMDSKMKDIELGMTKKKVISILGKDFESAGARMTSEGSIETISYKTASMTENTEGYYLLSFKDGKLVEWFKEKYPVHNHQH
ncbi:hypothetical protein PRABACTJOHN_01858 [Parabacteroides johnsonii DSM 18315]|nr:hypothetical protein PRABACTJOHN_01858 [Parabacteroides johnsonii DSM 18315]